jgi:hypothetical protein
MDVFSRKSWEKPWKIMGKHWKTHQRNTAKQMKT